MGLYAFAKGGCRDVRPAAHLLFLRCQEKKAKEGDPTVCVPALRFGQPAVLASSGVSLELASFHYAQTIAIPDPLAAALLGAYRGEWEPNSHSGHCFARPSSSAQVPRAGRSATRVERSDDPNGCLDVHPLLAAPAAGRLRGGMGVEAPMLRDLTRRGCPSGAAQQQSEFHGAPRKRTAAGLPRSAAQGSQTGGRLFFAHFLLAKQKKVSRPPGRNPGSRPQQRHTPHRTTKPQTTGDEPAHYQFNSCPRLTHKRQSPIQSKIKPHPTPATPHSPAPTAATAAGTQPPAPAAPHGTTQPPTCPASPPAPGAWAPSCARR